MNSFIVKRTGPESPLTFAHSSTFSSISTAFVSEPNLGFTGSIRRALTCLPTLSTPVVSFPRSWHSHKSPGEAFPSSSSLLISPVMNGHVPFQQAGQVERGWGAVCCAQAAYWLLSKGNVCSNHSAQATTYSSVWSSWGEENKLFSGYSWIPISVYCIYSIYGFQRMFLPFSKILTFDLFFKCHMSNSLLN